MNTLNSKAQTIRSRADFEKSIAKITHWQELIDQEEEKIFDYFNQNPEALMGE
jgi:hypothetical protein